MIPEMDIFKQLLKIENCREKMVLIWQSHGIFTRSMRGRDHEFPCDARKLHSPCSLLFERRRREVVRDERRRIFSDFFAGTASIERVTTPRSHGDEGRHRREAERYHVSQNLHSKARERQVSNASSIQTRRYQKKKKERREREKNISEI